MFHNILRDPGAVTPWFHESSASSDWYDFVCMRLVRKSDWHEVFTWDQPSLKTQFIYYSPAWNASMSLIKCACSKQKSQTSLKSVHVYGVPHSVFRPLWVIHISSAMAMVIKLARDDNYFILASRFLSPSCKQNQALVWSWSKVVPP